jgi:hypothetical protein
MPRLAAISPLVTVPDVAAHAAFFRDVLGFALPVLRDDYAKVARDAVTLRLIPAPPGTKSGADPSTSQPQACSIDVEDIDALYAELKPQLDRLPPGRVRAPFDLPYGQREFHVTDEGSLLIRFGEPVARRDQS